MRNVKWPLQGRLNVNDKLLTAQRFLLCVPGGVFGKELEDTALAVLHLENEKEQLSALHK